jgi:hypothetical protein
MFQLYSHHQACPQSLVELYMLNAYAMLDSSTKQNLKLPHNTTKYIQRQKFKPTDDWLIETLIRAKHSNIPTSRLPTIINLICTQPDVNKQLAR